MKRLLFGILITFQALVYGQTRKTGPNIRSTAQLADTSVRIRKLVDTVGFAHLKDQIENLAQRIDADQGVHLADIRKRFDISGADAWRLAIAPHDDYTYAGYMYPLVLKNMPAKTVIIFGVAHKAAQMHLENKLIFDSYTHWSGPYGPVKVSSVREDILKELPADTYEVNDSMQSIEHSVEAELPWLQYYNHDVEIISILVPPMSFERMKELAQPLARALAKAFKKRDLEWGIEASLLISTDAVHYGDEGWGDKNYAFLGTDSIGYKQAIDTEHTIIQNCLAGDLKLEKIKRFTQYTVQQTDFHVYKWTWCGRYSVPVGMLTALYLQDAKTAVPLSGLALDYCTSIDHPSEKVDDLKMGVLAKASLNHWVGYASVVFR